MIISEHERQGDFGSADHRRSDENAAMLLDATRVRGVRPVETLRERRGCVAR